MYGATAIQGHREADRLNQVQYKALMTSRGAFKGTALSALQVHCGEKPLELQRTEHILKYTARLKFYNNKKTHKLLQVHWTDLQRKKVVSMKTNVEEFWKEQTVETEVKNRTGKAPWEANKLSVDVSLIEKINKTANKKSNMVVIEDRIDSNLEDITIYNDASNKSSRFCGI